MGNKEKKMSLDKAKIELKNTFLKVLQDGDSLEALKEAAEELMTGPFSTKCEGYLEISLGALRVECEILKENIEKK